MHWTGISIGPCSFMCALNVATSGRAAGMEGENFIVTSISGQIMWCRGSLKQREQVPDGPTFECVSLCSANTAGDGKISSQIKHLCFPVVLCVIFI